MISITRASVDQLPSAAVILAEAFIDDPVMAAILPPCDRRRERLTTLFLAILRSGPHPAGAVDIAVRDSDGVVVGAAAWEAPGSLRGSTWRHLLELPRFAEALGVRGLIPAARILFRMERTRPSVPHWYLGQIGVSSAARGLGVGSRLLATHLAVVDAGRQYAYLESSTPANRRLYLRSGFEERGVIDGIPGAAPVAMLRIPQAPANAQ